MAKYSLERGIRGSEARHITTGEYYRNIFEQAENAREKYSIFQQQKEEKEQAVKERLQKEQQEAQRLSSLRQEIHLKESELQEKEKTTPAKVVKIGIEKTAKEAGKEFLDGVSRLMGNPKTKRLEGEIDTLKEEIETLQEEKENTHKQAQKAIQEKRQADFRKIQYNIHTESKTG